MAAPADPFGDQSAMPLADEISSITEALSMMRTVSSEGATLAHPKPDLQTTQGAYVGNVERLEEHAERMSVGGSDIGEEIRKLHTGQKLSESSRSSVCSPQEDELVRSGSHRSRRASSIVDVNHAARWGGYSPGAYISPPLASSNSASWSQTSLHRQLSASRASRLGVVTEPVDGISLSFESPTDLGTSPSYFDNIGGTIQSAFTDELRSIAQDIQQQLDDSDVPVPGPESDFAGSPEEAQVADSGLQQSGSPYGDVSGTLSEDAPDVPVEPASEMPEDGAGGLRDRSASTASNWTFKQAQRLFNDFDGVHCTPASREVSGGLDADIASHRASDTLPQSNTNNWIQPPPNANMVFYPAPVPKMLNLPQRLSVRPPAPAQAQRREKVMSMMIPQIREEAPWDEQERDLVPELVQRPTPLMDRAEKAKSMGARRSTVVLPPQARASVFFDPPPVHHEVEVKGDSAVVTLDSILEASASAPVGAFTNHPFAGREGARVYRREPGNVRRSTMSLLPSDQVDARASMMSLTGISGGKDPAELKKRGSTFSLLFGRRPQSTANLLGADTLAASQLGSGDRPVSYVATGSPNIDDEIAGHEGLSPSMDEERAALRRSVTPGTPGTPGAEFDEMNEEQGYYQVPLGDDDAEDGEDYDPYNVQYAAPTTLLAELQNRKAQQKSRSRTAATAFPNGMHSTLLELDAVEEMEHRRRLKKRVALAWEDPDVQAQAEAEQDDEDVPLGLLFTKQNGTVQKATLQEVEANAAAAEADWDRPLGLIERRELEDHEPLSKRRNRLKGVEPQTITKRHTMFQANSQPSQSHLGLPRASTVNLLMTNKGLAPVPTTVAPVSDPEEPAEEDDDDVPLAQRAQRLKTRNALSMAISDLEGDRPPSGEFLGDMLSQFGVSEEQTEAREKSPGVPDLSVTPDPEEETLGQRRARLQTQAALERPAISRRTSGSSGQLLNGARLSGPLPEQTPSAVDDHMAQERQTSGLTLSGLRPSRSMADLLAAHPLTANAHTALKVSDDQLTGNLPAGSLLAQNEQLRRRNKERLSSANAFNSGAAGMHLPLTGYIADSSMRQASGTFDRASMLMSQQGLPTPALGMGAQMSMQGYGGMPYASPMQMQHASMGYSPQAQMQMQMQMLQMQQYMGAMGGGVVDMPAGGMGGAYRAAAQQRPTTYAAYAQQQMGMGLPMGMAGMHPDMSDIRPEQRDLIDRWRQGVM